MLEALKYLNNVGRFASFQGTPDTALKPVTLIYAENGRGKTTLCAVLRSASTGVASHILERKRASANGDPHAVLQCKSGTLSFDGKQWTGAGPKVLIFDDSFTDANVHSGLSVHPSHRQNLHDVVIGEAGVASARNIESLTAEIAKLAEELREKTRRFTPAVLGPFTADEFCVLPDVPDLDARIADARASVAVLRDAAKVRAASAFQPLTLPEVAAEVLAVLPLTLSDIDADSMAAVRAHLNNLPKPGEAWVSQGVGLLGTSQACPFCAQSVAASPLVDHYRSYFSAAYTQHKQRIANARSAFLSSFGGDHRARTQSLLEQARANHAFWAPHIELPAFPVTAAAFENAWTTLRDRLLPFLDSKVAAPLEPIAISADVRAALDAYVDLVAELHQVMSACQAKNSEVQRLKEKAAHGNLSEAEAHLAKLEAIRRRLQPDNQALCADYTATSRTRAEKDKAKQAAREALATHRDAAFRRYQTLINDFLGKFNADFRLDEFSALDGRGGLSSIYQVGVNQGSFPLAAKEGAPPQPTFRSALSAGDRNTLALALFFAQLSERTDLADCIVVLDDPASSLDDHRSWATVHEIQQLVGRAKQVLLLSHSKPLLCRFWEHVANSGPVTLEICDVGSEQSGLRPWNVREESVSEYDRLHALVHGYANTGVGDQTAVAPALRVVLERFLRVAFTEHCPAGTLLGPFLNAAKNAAQKGTPVLSEASWKELDQLRTYSNQFHHDTNEKWQENLSNLNRTQLRGFAKRVIAFTRLAGAAGVPAAFP